MVPARERCPQVRSRFLTTAGVVSRLGWAEGMARPLLRYAKPSDDSYSLAARPRLVLANAGWGRFV